MAWTKQTKPTDNWTKQTRELDYGTGFLNSPGFLSQGFLSTPSSSQWTKQTKPTDSWSTVTRAT